MRNEINRYGLGVLFIMIAVLSWPLSASSDEIQNMQTFVDPFSGVEIVLVKGGCFEMGCGDWMIDCEENEKPAHRVCVEPFWIGKYEVTQEQWTKVMGENPSDYKGGDQNPVEMVSWNDIQVFLARVNEKSDVKIKFRLPTEAEWEYAARSGGKKEIYAGGNSVQDGLWHEFKWGKEQSFDQGIQSWPVGEKKPNGLGLYDMSGNVSEWCSDLYLQNYETATPEKNPYEEKKGKYRVYRGGSYSNFLNRRRTTWRTKAEESWRCYDLGFRVAADPVKN